MIIKIIRANRGFWNDLYSCQLNNCIFMYDNIFFTEDIIAHSKKILWKLSQMKLFDTLGFFQVVNVDDNDSFDVCFSYNRFLNTKKPYVVGVENPTAMVHYHGRRAKSLMGKKRLDWVFSNTNLKVLCCLSKACEKGINRYYDIPDNIKVIQVYPYIKDCITEKELEEKITSNIVNFLFVSSNFNLKGGNELYAVIKENNLMNNKDIHIDIITRISGIEKDIFNDLNNAENISVHDYKFSKQELNEFYKKANVFINMTRMDSFSLVTLEALKYANAFITTDMYAIKEMVHHNINGFLIKPTVKVWNDDYTRNENKNINRGLDKPYIDMRIKNFLREKIQYILKNPDILIEMQKNSYKIANEDFSNEKIKNKWQEVFECCNK